MNCRLLGVGAALALAGAALADVVTYTTSIPATYTNWNLPLTLPQFDATQGHLDSVDITFTGSTSSTVKIENQDPTVETYSASASYALVLSDSVGTLLSLTPAIAPVTGTLQTADQVLDFSGSSGITVANIAASASGSKTLTADADLAPFIGSGNVSLPVDAKANSSITTSANSVTLILTQAAAGITVTYHYTPYALGSIGDHVFFDANNNGIQDAGEKGVQGVTVQLISSTGAVLKTTSTDSSGNYLFQGLAAGDYRVQFVKPADYAYSFTKENAGTDDNLDSDADQTGLTALVHLNSGQNRLDVDAGLVGTLCLGDRVFKDWNGNGLQDSGEPGVPGVPVHLLDEYGNDIADTVTDCNGLYKFSNLAAGSYTVDFDAPTGYGFTKLTSNAAYKAVDSNADPVTGLAPVNLTANDLTIDAGLIGAQKIGDQVWLDCDGDGVFDVLQGEKGIPNVHVYLWGYLNNDYIPDVYLTTTTDANGHYLFNGLFPGTYVVAVNAGDLKGLTQTYDLDGNRTPYYAIGTLPAGMDNLNFDFGYRPSNNCGCANHCWWQCNTDCWPTSCVTLGGKCHTKAQACSWLKVGNCADKSVCVYQRLCASKLNVGSGCDHGKVYTCGKTTCSVKDAIKCVDAWLCKHPVGCNVSANSSDWASISDCYGILDKFCSGN